MQPLLDLIRTKEAVFLVLVLYVHVRGLLYPLYSYIREPEREMSLLLECDNFLGSVCVISLGQNIWHCCFFSFPTEITASLHCLIRNAPTGRPAHHCNNLSQCKLMEKSIQKRTARSAIHKHNGILARRKAYLRWENSGQMRRIGLHDCSPMRVRVSFDALCQRCRHSFCPNIMTSWWGKTAQMGWIFLHNCCKWPCRL